MTRAKIEAIAARPHDATGAEVGQLARDYLRLMDRVEGELTTHSDAIRAGLEEARERGAHIGRPPIEIDMERVIELWTAGYGLKTIARKMGHTRATIRRRLDALGMGR